MRDGRGFDRAPASRARLTKHSDQPVPAWPFSALATFTPGFTFTPAISLFVSCADKAKIAHYFTVLAEGGQVLMPLDTYPFSPKFGWVQDRFGVSWQLSAS